MLPIKIPYYPHVQATLTETVFGAVEISCPEIYETALTNKIIVRVDLLECLRPLWGDNCQIYRCLLYRLVSGSCSEDDHRKLFASFYRKYKPITAYVNNLYNYGEKQIPIVERTLSAIRELINTYREEVMLELSAKGGKYLVATHDYLYYAFTPGVVLPNIKGAKVIC